MTTPSQSSSDPALDAAKKSLRERAMARRAEAHADIAKRFGAAHAGEALSRNFLAAITPPAGAAVSAFWPVRDEIDVRPLMFALHERGHVCGLPVIVAKRAPLVFKRWDPHRKLVEGRWGIPVPPPGAEEVIPELMLVPLLAFDAKGNRIGYGAGFYDRTIALLRSRPGKRPLAVGVGYAAQQVEHVPCDETDERLDWVITEGQAIRFD